MLLPLIPDLSFVQWLLVLVMFLMAFVYLSRKPLRHIPPGPLRFPVIGSLPYLGGDIRVCLAKLAAKYGDVFTIYMGAQRIVVLNRYDAIKDAFVTQSGQFDDRSPMFDDLTRHKGLSTSSGEHWKQHRRLFLRAMKDFGLLGSKMEAVIHDESRRLVSVLTNMCGSPCKVEPILRKAASSIISRLFGKYWDYDDPEFAEHIKISDLIMLYCGADNPVWTFTKLKYIPGDPFHYHKTIEMFHSLTNIYKGWINEQKQRIDSGEEASNILGLYLQEMNKADPNEEFSVDALAVMMENSFLAGTDTTSSTLVWTLLQLILNPHLQQKIQAEIDDVIGRDRLPLIQDRSNMPHTEAVISEVQRWADLVPLAVPHYTFVEREFRGYVIPKDTMILANFNSVHHDPQLWPQPETFDPERFLKDGKYKSRAELIPFSLGKRNCVGEGLAKMEVFIFLTHLLQTFNFSVAPGQPKPSTDGVLGLTYQAKPFDLIINLRG